MRSRQGIVSRTNNEDFVDRWSSDVMKTCTTAESMRLFEEADIAHAPLHDLDSLIDDPHLAAVDLIQSIDHPTEGPLRVAGPAATLDPAIPAPPRRTWRRHSLRGRLFRVRSIR